MSSLLQQFFSSHLDSDPLQHIHRLETTTLYDDKLSSIAKLVSLSTNSEYDGFFMRLGGPDGDGATDDATAGLSGEDLASSSSASIDNPNNKAYAQSSTQQNQDSATAAHDKISSHPPPHHSIILNRLIDLLCQDIDSQSLAENYITILLNVLSRVIQAKQYRNRVPLLLRNVNLVPILIACLGKESPYMIKNTLRLFFLLYQYDYQVGFLLLRNNGLRNFVALLNRNMARQRNSAQQDEGATNTQQNTNDQNGAQQQSTFEDDDQDLEVKTYALQFLIALTSPQTPGATVQQQYQESFGISQVTDLAEGNFSIDAVSTGGVKPMNQMERNQKEEILKFLAFEGIFDTLFQLIEYTNEDIKALALRLMKNLVTNSESNQRHFIQAQYLPFLLKWIQLPPLDKQSIFGLAKILHSHYKVFNEIRLLALETLSLLLRSQSEARDVFTSAHSSFLFSTILHFSLMKDIQSCLNEIGGPGSRSASPPDHQNGGPTPNQSFATSNQKQSTTDYSPFATDSNSDWNIDYIESIQVESLCILGKSLDANKDMQHRFVEFQDLIFESQTAPCCALVRLCRMAIGHPIVSIREAAMRCLKQFLHNNEEGQYVVATTYRLRSQSQSDSTEAGVSCGITLTNSVFVSEEPTIVYRACSIFLTVLQQNPQCEMILLEKPYDDSSTPPKSFFASLVRDLLNNLRDKAPKTKLQILIGQLQLICQCVNNSEEAAHKFVSSSSGLMFMIDYLLQNENEEHEAYIHTRGLIALLIGLIMLYYPHTDSSEQQQNSEASSSLSKKALHDVVLRKIGLRRLEQELTQFNNMLDREDIIFQTHDSLYSTQFVAQFKLWKDTILNYLRKPEEERLTSMKDLKALKEKLQRENIDELNKLRHSYDEQIKQLQSTIESSEKDKEDLQRKIDSLHEEVTNVNNQLKESQKLAAAASQVDELKEQIEKLKSQMEERDQIHNSTVENLQNQMQQKQTELEKLTEVYNDMDTEHDEELEDLRNQNQKLKSKIQALEKQKQEQSGSLQRLEEELTQVRAELSEKQNSVSEDQMMQLEERFNSEKQQMRAEFDSEKERMRSQYEQDVQQMQSRFDQEKQQLHNQYDSEKRDLENRMSIVQQENVSINSDMQRMEQQSQQAGHQSQQLQQQLQQIDVKLQEKTMQAEEQQKIIEQLHTDLDKKQMVVSQYESVILQRDQRIRDVEAEFEKYKEQGPNAQLQKRVEDLENKIADLIQENKEKTEKVKELEGDNEDLMQIVEMLENKNEELKGGE